MLTPRPQLRGLSADCGSVPAVRRQGASSGWFARCRAGPGKAEVGLPIPILIDREGGSQVTVGGCLEPET